MPTDIAPGSFWMRRLAVFGWAVVAAFWVTLSSGAVGAGAAGVSWTQQSSGTSDTLSAVHFRDASRGWAVGADGVVVSTTDGGIVWAPQSTPTSDSLYSVHFVDDQNGWAVGGHGTLLHTVNAGAGWIAQDSSTTDTLYSVHFVDALHGWAAGWGGRILSTTNGGVTWVPRASGTGSSLQSIRFDDTLVGWAVGTGGTILRTVNGGVTWIPQDSGTTEDLYSIEVRDRSTAWAVGDNGRILLTTNGGATWTVPLTGVIPSLVSVDFVDGNLGWAVGQSGTILSTVDGGRVWSAQSSGTTRSVQAVHFPGSGIGWAVGEGGTILRYGFTSVPGSVTRVAGSDRYVVAASLARRGWDPAGMKAWTNVNHIVIANGEPGKEADPLSAAGLAGAYDAPILLVRASAIPAATKSLIAEIAKKRQAEGRRLTVHIIGGTSTIPDARWNEIRAIPGVSSTKDRLAGSDRYAVSATIARRIVDVRGTSDVPGVILIAADNPAAFYDALAASPIAYAQRMPMLSVRKSSVPPSVSSVLSTTLSGKPRYAASSSAYIGSVPGAGAQRLTTSSDRYVAATQIAAAATRADRRWLALANSGLTAKLPDALAGGAFLGERGGVMLFTDSSTAVRSATKSYIATNGRDIDRGWILGGTVSVPTAQETTVRSLIAK